MSVSTISRRTETTVIDGGGCEPGDEIEPSPVHGGDPAPKQGVVVAGSRSSVSWSRDRRVCLPAALEDTPGIGGSPQRGIARISDGDLLTEGDEGAVSWPLIMGS